MPKMYDLLGSEVVTLVNVKKDAGRFASGIYFYTLQAGESRETKRMILMK